MNTLSVVILLLISNSSLFVVPMELRPASSNESKDKKLPTNKKAQSNLPSININVIVVPIVRETGDELTKLKDIYGRPFSQHEKVKPSTGSENSFSTTEESLQDLETSALSSVIHFGDRKDPAPGIISPQREHVICKGMEVYDRQLGQCIKRNPGSCPLCRRTQNG